MKLSIPVLLVVVSISLFSCKKQEPMFAGAKSTAHIGDIYYTGSPCVGYKVSFASSSYGAKTYYWDFGDGTFSTEELPSHIYTSAGTYTAKLTLDANPTKTASKSTEIYPVPTLTATLDGLKTWKFTVHTYQGGRDTTNTGIVNFAITYVDPVTIVVQDEKLYFQSSSEHGGTTSITYKSLLDMAHYGGGHQSTLTIAHSSTTESIHYSFSSQVSLGSSSWGDYDTP